MALNGEKVYGELLKLEWPWRVDRVEMDEKQERVDIHLEHDRNARFLCKECGEEAPTYDHAPERMWRHLDLFEYAAYIHARLPRTQCKRCGVRLIVNEWAEGGSSFTAKFERRVIDLAKECSVEGVRRLARLTWDQTWGGVKRAVKRGLARKERKVPRRIGVDEKSFAKRHKYETLVCDLDAGTVEYVADGRDAASLAGYFKQFSRTDLEGIEAIAMDMWPAYIAAAREHVPRADEKIVFDKFHIVRGMTEAVDKVRRREHKELEAQGVDWLKRTRFLWLCNEENVPAKRRSEFEALKGKDLKVGRAWSIKENLRWLWEYRSKGWARRFFDRWYGWAARCRLVEVAQAARTIRNHIDNILTFVDHRVTNATAEGLNSKIEKVKKMACGFRNREHYRTAILFHCGGLDMYPRPAA